MKYAELTEDQKADIAEIDRWRRSILADLLRVAKSADATVVLPRAYAVDEMVAAQLDETESVPNATGYAGAKPLNRDRWLAVGSLLMQAFTILQQTTQTDPTLIVDSIGVNAG